MTDGGPLPMSDGEIARVLRLLRFVAGTDAETRTLRQFHWALLELIRRRQTMASVLVRYPKTASNRARLLGQLDRLGRGNEALSETDDELIAVVMDYAGDADAANEHFAGASEIHHNDYAGVERNRVPRPGESEDWEPLVEIDGEIIARPASSREGPPAPPETDAAGGTAPDEGGEPDTADTPSGHLSGAAIAQATADKRKAAKK